MVVVLVHLGGAPGPVVPSLGAGAEALAIDDEGELTRLARLGGAVHAGHGGGGGAGRSRGCAAAWDGNKNKVSILMIDINFKEIE